MDNRQSLQLVTWEQAKRLKQAGFNWETDRLYCKPHPSRPEYLIPNNAGITEHYLCFAPTVALALKWMRDVKGFAFYVRCEHEWETNSERVYFDPVSWYGEYENSGAISNTDTVNTYESAESALLDELLRLIETENKNQQI